MAKPKKMGLARLAQSLTLMRMLATPAFLWVFLRLEFSPDLAWRIALLAIYAGAVLSDLLDGPLARRASTRSYFWGQMDVLADVAFNGAVLSAAVWVGRVGFWVPLSLAALGANFLWRCRRYAGRSGDSLPEDSAGKWAGVFFYVLVGAVVLDASFPAAWLSVVVYWLSRVAFLYALWLLFRDWFPPRRRFG